ncbi:hypothetical protein Ahy_A04g021373 isoform B [Arachis hypogaea]|uniref:NAD(P)-binding domain-containing protein n=1 Tax=Arachis hypogaea TaxID=3818 RepID=A0A445DK15_ARAHY|nr:hypothetical protein Ahy_A04g021373 isoform B [Arachis hypogaea]
MKMGLRSIVHLSSITLCMHHTQTQIQFQRFGFPYSKSKNLLPSLSTTPSWGIKLKSKTLSLSLSLMASATHFQVSAEDGSVPSQELGSSPSHAIGQHDLLIVGPGVLGRLVAQKWREEYPGCQVFGQTVTTNHHEELIKLGISPSLKWTKEDYKFPYVIFCAPPYQSADYPGDLRQAALCWNGEGAFLFTSSSAPYDCNDNGFCDEDTPVVPFGRSPRTDVLLKAENVVLEFGGSVDAASLSITILKKKCRRKIFLGCDNHPLSRQEVMDLVNQSGKFSKRFEKFTGTDDPLGKRLNNSRTRAELGWEPKYTSFAHFLETL